MGYIRHHAILVTVSADDAERVRGMLMAAAAGRVNVSEPVPGTINHEATILVAPDCSKEGWPHSYGGDDARDDIVRLLRERSGFYAAWCEVMYGDEMGGLSIRDARNEAAHYAD